MTVLAEERKGLSVWGSWIYKVKRRRETQPGAWGCAFQLSFKVQGEKEVVLSTGSLSGRMGGMCLLWKGDTRTWDRVSETGPWSVEHLPLLSQDIKLWPFSWACAMKDLPSSFGANSFTIGLSAPSNHKHRGCLLSAPGCILWTQRWVRLWALPWELHSLVQKLPWKPRYNTVPRMQQMHKGHG